MLRWEAWIFIRFVNWWLYSSFKGKFTYQSFGNWLIMWFQNNNYEHRRFTNLTWVSVVANSLVYDESNFVDIFNYINGENSEGNYYKKIESEIDVLLLGIKIEGGSPMMTGRGMRPCAFCAFNSSKFFYVSSDDQTDLPLPLSDKILLLPFNEFEVYVRLVYIFLMPPGVDSLYF